MRQKIITLDSEKQEPGPHGVVWNGTNDSGQPVSNGIYFAKIFIDLLGGTGKAHSEIRKLMLTK